MITKRLKQLKYDPNQLQSTWCSLLTPRKTVQNYRASHYSLQTKRAISHNIQKTPQHHTVSQQEIAALQYTAQ